MKSRLPQSQLGWRSRACLPHFDGGELAQFITFCWHDALLGSVLARWKEELKHEKPGEVESIMRRRIEAYLDQGHGNCYLKDWKVQHGAERVALSGPDKVSIVSLDDNAEPRSFVGRLVVRRGDGHESACRMHADRPQGSGRSS